MPGPCAAGQLAVAFDLLQRQEQAAVGVPVDEQGAGDRAIVTAVRAAAYRRDPAPSQSGPHERLPNGLWAFARPLTP